MKAVHGLLLGFYKVQASETSDDNFTNTLASCLDFASKFDNTCDDLTVQTNLDQVTKREVKCAGAYGACPVSGTETDELCSF